MIAKHFKHQGIKTKSLMRHYLYKLKDIMHSLKTEREILINKIESKKEIKNSQIKCFNDLNQEVYQILSEIKKLYSFVNSHKNEILNKLIIN